MALEDMAVMPLADYEAACNAIRAKDGSSGTIVSGDLATKINNIPSGTDMSDSTAKASDLLSGKVAYTKNGRISGTISSVSATTYYPSTSSQSIASGKYLSGTQTIEAVKVTNLSPEYIRAGTTVKVGDRFSEGRIASVTGTYGGDTVTLTGSGSNGTVTVSASQVGNKSILAWEIYGGSGSGAVYNAFGWSSGGTGFAYAGTYQSSTIYHKVTCSASKGEVVGANQQIWFTCSTAGYSFSGSYTAKIIFG